MARTRLDETRLPHNLLGKCALSYRSFIIVGDTVQGKEMNILWEMCPKLQIVHHCWRYGTGES